MGTRMAMPPFYTSVALDHGVILGDHRVPTTALPLNPVLFQPRLFRVYSYLQLNRIQTNSPPPGSHTRPRGTWALGRVQATIPQSRGHGSFENPSKAMAPVPETACLRICSTRNCRPGAPSWTP